MDADKEITELRYQETMAAIYSWVASQDCKMSPAEARGIARAFITHASMALISTLPGCDDSDCRLLTQRFFEALKKFVEEKIDEYEY